VTIDERLEKLAERHEALTQSLELLVHGQADAEERQKAAAERHDREMEEIRREGRAMRADMRRAFSMGVQEARNARRRRQELEKELDAKITQLAAAQLVTEEKLQRFIESVARRGNGNAPVQ
jgi:hypothetical protein